MKTEFVFSGFGGQGVMFAGQLLAYAALDEGLNVTWIPSYGPEMRGGTAHCTVTISDHPIGSPLAEQPTVALLFNQPSYTKYETRVAPDGLMVVNSSLVRERSNRSDLTRVYVPATDLAYEIRDPRMTNMVMLGAALEIFPVLSLLSLKYALEDHIPERHRHLLDFNHKAIDAGSVAARAHIFYQSSGE